MAGLGDLDRWVMLATVPPFRFGLKKCSAEELEILEQGKHRVTLRRLAWAPGGLTLSRLRATYALLASGLLQEQERAAPTDGQPVIQMETSTFLLSALRRRPDPTAGEVIRQEVAGELERSARLDRETWLRVSRSAPREELLRALEDKMEYYHSLLDAAGEDSDLKTDIELILGRASSMLRLARQSLPGPGAAPERKVPLAAPPPVAPAPAPSVAATPPPAPAPPAAEPPASSPAAESPASAGESPAAAASRPPPVVPMASEMALEHLLMEGEVRMTVSDYANAYKTYARVVELAPNVPAFRVKLAVAMAFYPPTAKQAEREFLEAIRLDPHNPDLHYQFGLYYKAMKVKSRAITEMQTAVRLNPRHKLARQELEALSPRDSALTSFKKLFK